MLDVPFRSAKQLAADIRKKKINCLELLDLYISRLPVGVQIVGPQFGDLTCLALAKLLERRFQAFVPAPGYG